MTGAGDTTSTPSSSSYLQPSSGSRSRSSIVSGRSTGSVALASVMATMVPPYPHDCHFASASLRRTHARIRPVDKESSYPQAGCSSEYRLVDVWYQGRGRPGQRLLAEEGRGREPLVEAEDQPGERRHEGDDKDPADLPVQARHGPEGVAVAPHPVALQGDPARDVHDQAAEQRQDAPHPEVALALEESLPVVPDAGKSGEPVVER